MLIWSLLLAHAEDSRGARLAALRAEVETLRSSHRRDSAELDARLASIERARSDAEVALSTEQLALRRLQSELDEQRTSLGTDATPYAVLEPALLAGVAGLRSHIERALPFRQPERLSALDTLAGQIRSQTLPPDKALARLWQAVEDELALQRENALDRQVVTLEGEERLVSVARLGMVALYYRTDAGETGWWQDGDWVRAPDRRSRAQIDELFTALERKIRIGWFELPGLPEHTP